ncbi:vesicular glutamate transporter 2 isoform X6 [Cimex lectularius]|uniref:Sialin n=1 Tax=Cimex lectularius TaxID=79782 RepID=A0A8I6RRK1_CIMLE|nr:vesicular glutamate transporter 2 isoform X6 [Cimex lectularius]
MSSGPDYKKDAVLLDEIRHLRIPKIIKQIRQGSSRWKFWERRRHVVALLAFFGFFNIYSLRVNLSVAIVAMTSPYNVTLENGTTVEKTDFDWDSKTKGLVLSSFFYGYICTQLLGGWLGNRYGGAKIYMLGVSTTALLTLLTPPIANTSVYYLVFLRVIEGVFEGVTYPCMHSVWARWAPPSERSAMASLAFSGSYVGTVVALPVSGMLSKHCGWPSVFYVTGVVGLIWSVVWWYQVKDDPENDPRISESELTYLRDTLGNRKNHTHPWGEFVKSMPVWAVVMAHFCENWGFYTLLTQLPTFMKDTLNFDLQKAGFLSSVPYLVMAIIMQFAGHLSDWLCNKKIMSTTNVRKLFNCTAFLSQTIFMMLASYLLTATGVVTCLVFAVGLGALAWPAFSVNHLDLAPQHASVLMGMSNTFATLPGIISPLISGYIVTNKSAEEWKVVFYIASTIYLIGAIFYCIFASAERQPWAVEKDEKGDKTEHAYTNNGLSVDKL